MIIEKGREREKGRVYIKGKKLAGEREEMAGIIGLERKREGNGEREVWNEAITIGRGGWGRLT